MKKLLLVIPIALLVFSCKKDNAVNPTPETQEPIFTVSETEVNGSYSAFKDTIQIKAESQWSITGQGNWLTVSPESGSGNTDVIVSLAKNPDIDSRTKELTVATESMSKTITVTQEGNSALDTSAAITIDREGGYLDLMQSGSYMVVEDDDAFDIPAGKSFSISLKVKTTYSQNGRILHRKTGSYNKGYSIFMTQMGKVAFVYRDGYDEYLSSKQSTSVINDGEWHHLVMVFDGTNQKTYVYIDGQKEGVRDYSATTIHDLDISRDLLIGVIDTTSSFREFKGYIDDLKLWNKALTKPQIYADAANIALSGSADGLIADWDFDNVTGNTVSDVSSNQHSGVLKAGAAIVSPQ